MLLENVKGFEKDAELDAAFASLTEEVNAVIKQISIILESPADIVGDRLAGGRSQVQPRSTMPRPGQLQPEGGDLQSVEMAMTQVMKQMDAAKRGMGLVNKLSDSPSRSRNKSRVMGNINKIRGNLQRIAKMLVYMKKI